VSRPYGSSAVRLADFGGDVVSLSVERAWCFWRRIAGPTTVTPRAVYARRPNFWRGRVEAAMRHDRVAERPNMD
jgi:hypothetical protein